MPGEPTAIAVAALPEVLTREQAAWLLRLSPGRLDAAVKRGEVPARKVGRKWLFSKTALLAVFTGAPDASGG
ncbi:MAG: helix-turn-helix domain-containing protein [Sporichthyaceae bacterium]